jgi:hypothetical protein
MIEIINFLGFINNVDQLSAYLRKVFEGVNQIIILPDDTYTVYAVKSIEGEILRLKSNIDIKDLNIEKWINELHENIVSTMRILVLDAYSKQNDFELSD